MKSGRPRQTITKRCGRSITRCGASALLGLDQEKIRLSDFDESTEGEFVFTALCGGNPAGFISIWEPDCFIHSLYVRRGCRGLGIGGWLIEEAVCLFGLPMTLKCMKPNTAAVDFYLSHGWRIEREDMGEDGPII